MYITEQETAYKIMKNTHQLEVIGMMSGTSLDGLDMAWCRFSKDNLADFDLLDYKTLPYPDSLQSRLAASVNLSAEELFALDAELGQFFGKAAASFIGNRTPPALIASHGHTVFHQPDRGFTVQVGNAAHIQAITAIPVVSDFRSQDVALGGQGAPLVPVGDALLLSDYDYCLNLGGITNISFRDDAGERRAFDITFANMVLNRLSKRLGQAYDEDGRLARGGQIIPSLAESLNNWAYYHKPAPKSLGYEDVSRDIFPLLSESEDAADQLRTCTQHMADQVLRVCTKEGKMLITGGGAHNGFLRECLATPGSVEVVYPEPWLVECKEAIVFALLGALRIWEMPNVLSSVTGASRDSISGQLLD